LIKQMPSDHPFINAVVKTHHRGGVTQAAFLSLQICLRMASATVTCYNSTDIKRGLTRPANLQLVQGGFPEREMWPKGNIERQPSSDKP
jgi:hypothetical protein